jgi:hypothetical protein
MAEQRVELRLGGATTASVSALLSVDTVFGLKASISRTLLGGDSPADIQLLANGVALSNASTLADAGVTASTRLLVLRGAAQAPAVHGAESRKQRLSRLLDSEKALAARGGTGRGAWRLELTNQDGDEASGVFSSELDKQAVVHGMVLHAEGRKLLRQNKAAEAAQVLQLCLTFCDSLSKADLARFDTPSLAGLDLCWALLLLRDSSRLAEASSRLAAARAGLLRAHGAALESAEQPQSALCRLCVLEGVALFLKGDASAAKAQLQAAKQRCSRLLCDPDSVRQLTEQGASEADARAALRACRGDLAAAAALASERRAAAAADRRRRRELASHGRTPRGRKVEEKELLNLVAVGYERALAAAALLSAENEIGAAIDILSDPERNSALQAALQAGAEAAGRKRGRSEALRSLQELGFQRSVAKRAMAAAGEDVSAAAELLLSGGLEEDAEGDGGDGAEEAEEAGVDAEVEEELAGAVAGERASGGYELDVSAEMAVAEEYLAQIG